MNSIIGGLLPVFLEYALPVLGTIIAAGVTWLLARLEQKFGLEIEAKHREALQEALTNAAGLFAQRLAERGETMSGRDPIVQRPSAADPKMNEAVDYVRNSVPDALKFFGITPQSIAQKVAAKLGRA